MRTRTNAFKIQIKEMGREIDSRITVDGMNNPILGEHLFAVSPILNTDILKSVMKGLNFESDIELNLNDRCKYEFGLLVNNAYEWLDYGYYYVFDKAYNEDTKHWTYTCYDKMVNSMKDYLGLSEAEFPLTIREFTDKLLDEIGITFSNSQDEFVNYDKVLEKDPYISIDNDGVVTSLGYKYRDVLDELSQVVAGNIMLDNNENAFIKYVNDTQDVINEEYFRDIDVKFKEKFGPMNTIILTRSADADSIVRTYPEDLDLDDRIPLEIKDNQIMNGNDRGDYADAILNKLKGLEYYLNNYKSYGVMYLEAMDLYTASITLEDDDGNITNNTYKCLMLNSEPEIEDGLEEKIFTNLPDTAKTDYSNMTGDDRLINQVYIIAKKNEGVIESYVGENGEFTKRLQTVEGWEDTIFNDHEDITKIWTTINGLEVDITKKGENLVRNTMLWNYDGWLSNTFQPLAKGENPPTITGTGDVTFWYCTKTSSNYENGVIYQYNYSNQSWEATNMLRKDFYSDAGSQKGISIEEDKEKYLSGNKMILNYNGTVDTSNLGVYSELFEISPTQDTITFQFKMSSNIITGGFVIGIDLFNNEYVSRLDADNFNVGSYKIRVTESTNFDKYEIQIPLKTILNVVSGTTSPTSIVNYWLDTSDADAYILKKYNTETEQWENYVNPVFVVDQNNTFYRYRVFDGVDYYEEWTNDRTIRFGQFSILKDWTSNTPEMSIEVGDIKVEYGVGTDWSQREDEVYSINHKMDELGYTIRKGDNKLFLDEDELTGYYQNNKIFYINKNEVFSHISKSIINNIDGLITKKIIINNEPVYIRYIEED